MASYRRNAQRLTTRWAAILNSGHNNCCAGGNVSIHGANDKVIEAFLSRMTKAEVMHGTAEAKPSIQRLSANDRNAS